LKLHFADERVLAVVGHPDDAELFCAGTLARARDDGAIIAICTMCRGDKGGAANRAGDLAATRKREFVAAAKLLGAKAFFAGMGDGELADTPAHRRKLIRIYRQFKPTLVLAHAPDDYHADHRAASALAEAASWLACSAGHRTRQRPLAKPPAVWWMDTVNMIGFEPGFFVDVTDHLSVKQQMLSCHGSQLKRGQDPDFEPLDELMLRQAAARGAQAGVAAAEAFRMHAAWKRVRAW
jgi:LmbE family N-acetylglucosaminyl deacetylase